MQPKVTIGVPVYNGAKYLREALDSALAQTFTDFEIIISDNVSTDETRKIGEEYTARDSRITYVRQESNIGAVRNFAYLAENARGEYLTWLAHDDHLMPEFLERTAEYLRTHPNVVVVSGEFEFSNEGAGQVWIEKVLDLDPTLDWNTRRPSFFKYPGVNAFLTIYGLMRTGVCREVLRAFPFEDSIEWDVRIMPMFAVRGELIALPVVLRRIRIHDLSISASSGMQRARATLLQRMMRRFKMRNTTRIFQLSILVNSGLPFETKLRILGATMKGYAAFFAREQRTLPKRILSYLSGDR